MKSFATLSAACHHVDPALPAEWEVFAFEKLQLGNAIDWSHIYVQGAIKGDESQWTEHAKEFLLKID